MVAAGFLVPRVGTAVAALLALPAIAIGGKGLPVPGGPFHFPPVLTGKELAALVRHGGPERGGSAPAPLAASASSPAGRGDRFSSSDVIDKFQR